MKKMKRRKGWKQWLFPLIFLALMLVPIGSVLAESLSGDTVIVESGETLEKTSFISGENIRVDGDINGTTFITGGNIEVNGIIDGDLFVAGQSLTVNGIVNGSVFLTGQYLTINGEVENNIYGAGQGFKVQSQTNGNIFIVGQNVSIDENAVIERDAFIGATTIYHNGIVNGDFQSSSNSLTVGGKVTGDLKYSSQNQADLLDTSEILGETNWQKIETASTEDTKQFLTTTFLFRVLWSIGAAFLVWLLVRWVRPAFWPQLADQIMLHPLKTLGLGALGVVFIPIVAVLLMFTVIGIPLSFLLLVLYGVTLYLSKIIFAVYLSHLVQNRWNGSTDQSLWLFLLALILLISLGAVPIVGMILRFLTVSLGVGAMGFAFVNRQPQS